MQETAEETKVPVSIVCVYNDPEVLESCLARSIRELLDSAPATEFLPIDNRNNAFSTAGGALNEGAQRARNDVVVFVHQDVVLHSLIALERAAAVLLTRPDIGVAGAVGIDARHHILGRIRDRVVPIGKVALEPLDVDTLDEVLLIVSRDRILSEPLSEDPLLAWHAYGVEYCARSRHAGLRAVALEAPLTHNSLTTNLKDLDLAHHRVGEIYPRLLPIQTTCGTIHGDRAPKRTTLLRRRIRNAGIWWRESLEARAVAKVAPTSTVVLADVRLVVDEAMDRAGMTSLRVVDLVDDGAPTAADGLSRYGRSFSAATGTAQVAREAIRNRAAGELLLITAPTRSAISLLGPLGPYPHVIGHTRETGVWVLVGASAPTLQPLWSTRRSRPFAGWAGSRKPAQASSSPA
ncbi:glycosyltransferase [uncultured Microbacterium sp.]|uniref:glycosyltransferase n=1 Tax=uncultured Microbacterium sp. TaxID=191216 RepID=UPI0026321314|nr:glycosyltransferase [uncultured Microbacterium sp.]